MFDVARAALVVAGLVAVTPVMAQSRAQSGAQPGGGVPVVTASVTRRDVPVLLRNIGAVQAFQSVLVRPRVDGTITQVFFTEGQTVKPGDKLVQIDPRPYAAALAAVKAKKAADAAQLANAQRDLARYVSLASSNFASRQQMETQASLVAQLTATNQGDDAAIQTAQLNLDFTEVTSPIQGRTSLRLVDAGNLVHANDATGLVTIAQIQPIAVTFTLPQDELPSIQEAMAQRSLPVRAYTSDGHTLLATGELSTIENSIDQATGTIKLKAVFKNAESKLWPGQFVNVSLQLTTLTNVTTIPSAAVQHGPDGTYVYAITPDSTAAVVPIEVGQDDGQMALVKKGVDEGVHVVVQGQSRLQAGTRVAETASKPGT